MNGQNMKCDVLTCALSLANAAAAVWSLCTFLKAFMPEFATKLMMYTTHLSGWQLQAITIQSFIGGFVTVWVYAFIFGGLFAFFYNKSTK